MLTVFDVASPAAPPEPVSEVPDGPEQVQKEQTPPIKQPPQPELPQIQLNTTPSLQLSPARVALDPAPPVKETTAPERLAAPPAPKAAQSKSNWEAQVLSALNKVKRYPRIASARRQQGVPYIRFVIDRNGKLISVGLERRSGFAALDREALDLPARAQPFPRPPKDVTGETIELIVPVEFFMR